MGFLSSYSLWQNTGVHLSKQQHDRHDWHECNYRLYIIKHKVVRIAIGIFIFLVALFFAFIGVKSSASSQWAMVALWGIVFVLFAMGLWFTGLIPYETLEKHEDNLKKNKSSWKHQFGNRYIGLVLLIFSLSILITFIPATELKRTSSGPSATRALMGMFAFFAFGLWYFVLGSKAQSRVFKTKVLQSIPVFILLELLLIVLALGSAHALYLAAVEQRISFIPRHFDFIMTFSYVSDPFPFIVFVCGTAGAFVFLLVWIRDYAKWFLSRKNRMLLPGFIACPLTQKNMQTKADEAVILTHEKTGVVLDWSDESIRQAEMLLDNIYDAYYTKKHRTEDPGIEIIRLTYALGCYVGEVYRRYYQAQWGTMGGKGGKLLGLKTPSGLVFSPIEHALERAFDGRRESFNHYSPT